MATCSTCDVELGKQAATIDGHYYCLPCVLDLVDGALWEKMLPKLNAAESTWQKKNIRGTAGANRRYLREAKKLVAAHFEEACPS